MSVTVRHTFTSAQPDGPDSTLLQPSHWNADHQMIWVDPAYPTRQFTIGMVIRNEGTSEEYIETVWTEI